MSAACAGKGVVDVHAHFVTERYVDAARAAGVVRPDGMPGWPSWSAGEHLGLMDAHGIERAVLSISSPGVFFGDAAAAVGLARHVNEAAAQVCAAHPDRFSFFASVPMPDTDAAVAEAARALDELGAAGVVTLTNVAGLRCGDEAFAPLLAELDRRGTVLFVHPTSPPQTEAVDLGLPRPMLEFLVETTRTVTDLLLGGTLTAHPDLSVIATHCGGFTSLLVERLELFANGFGLHDDPAAVRAGLERLWFDLAGTPLPTQAPTLARYVGTDRLLFGSDYCWTPAALAGAGVEALDAGWPADLGRWRETTARAAEQLLEKANMSSNPSL